MVKVYFGVILYINKSNIVFVTITIYQNYMKVVFSYHFMIRVSSHFYLRIALSHKFYERAIR